MNKSGSIFLLSLCTTLIFERKILNLKNTPLLQQLEAFDLKNSIDNSLNFFLTARNQRKWSELQQHPQASAIVKPSKYCTSEQFPPQSGTAGTGHQQQSGQPRIWTGHWCDHEGRSGQERSHLDGSEVPAHWNRSPDENRSGKGMSTNTNRTKHDADFSRTFKETQQTQKGSRSRGLTTAGLFSEFWPFFFPQNNFSEQITKKWCVHWILPCHKNNFLNSTYLYLLDILRQNLSHVLPKST